nr:magnesium chelatase subunit D [uncultured Rhodopila sp.]
MSGAAAWAGALQALGLFAADPLGLGGIAVRAGAGPVRDRWLKILYDSLPPGMPVRRVPLNAGDDRLLGGLDLAATLQAGHLVEQKGLLSEADGGIIVLPMAERIEPAAAARLRAASDEGMVTLQRDGLSRVLPAHIAMVALDEGADPDEHPPASLLDRMAFLIDLTKVSLRDIEYDDWSGLPGSRPLVMAGEGPPSTPCDAAPDKGVDGGPSPAMTKGNASTPETAKVIETLCNVAMSLGVASIRAPLFALRAARIAAARDGRTEPDPDDLSLAVALVYGPRATRLPPQEEAEAPPEPEPPPEDQPEPPPPDDQDQEQIPDLPLEDIVLEAAIAALPPDLLAQLASLSNTKGQVRMPGRVGQAKMSLKRGRPVGTRQGEPKGGARLHLLETLKAAAPWQTLRRRAPEHGPKRFEVRRDDFRIVRFRQRVGTTTVFAVDASGSAAMNRLGEAKGAVELLLADCYVRRDQVALIAFRGTGAQLLLSPTGSLLRAKRSLAGLPGGGPTPLAAGIDAAMALADGIRRSGRTPIITFLTDARANMTRDGTGGRPKAEAEAMESARALRATGIAALMVDTSPRPNPFARTLAAEMGARYVPLPYANAAALSHAVRAAAA